MCGSMQAPSKLDELRSNSKERNVALFYQCYIRCIQVHIQLHHGRKILTLEPIVPQGMPQTPVFFQLHAFLKEDIKLYASNRHDYDLIASRVKDRFVNSSNEDVIRAYQVLRNDAEGSGYINLLPIEPLAWPITWAAT